jgi:hypothetical protein
MIEPEELTKILRKLKNAAPDVYRHIIGLIKAALKLYVS